MPLYIHTIVVSFVSPASPVPISVVVEVSIGAVKVNSRSNKVIVEWWPFEIVRFPNHLNITMVASLEWQGRTLRGIMLTILYVKHSEQVWYPETWRYATNIYYYPYCQFDVHVFSSTNFIDNCLPMTDWSHALRPTLLARRWRNSSHATSAIYPRSSWRITSGNGLKSSRRLWNRSRTVCIGVVPNYQYVQTFSVTTVLAGSGPTGRGWTIVRGVCCRRRRMLDRDPPSMSSNPVTCSCCTRSVSPNRRHWRCRVCQSYRQRASRLMCVSLRQSAPPCWKWTSCSRPCRTSVLCISSGTRAA